MARYWLEQRGARGTWRLCWTENRRKRTRSLRTSSEADAKEWLARFLAELNQPPRPEIPTVSAILAGYLRDRQGAVVDWPRLELCVRHLKRHMGWMHADDLRPSHSKAYAAARRKEGIKDGTIAKELRTLRAGLRWAVSERWIDIAPRVTPPRLPLARSRWLTRSEAAKLQASAVSAHVRLFIDLCLSTAARRSAVLFLRWEQIDLEARTIDFGAGVGNKRRAVVPINATLHASLVEAKTAAQTPWVIEFNGQRVGSIKKAFARAVKRAGIEHCTPHDLRRTAGSWMLQAGIPIEVISAMLGHSDIRITQQVYARFNVDWLRPAAAALEKA